MNIFQLNKILNEYNTFGDLTSITLQGGNKASGKSLDNIAAGITQPYKQNGKKTTENEKRFPNLAKLVNQMKKDSIKGNKIITGIALNELQLLFQTMNLRTDDNGDTILPFGDNVRLTQKGNNYFIRLNITGNNEKQNQQTDIMGSQLPIM